MNDITMPTALWQKLEDIAERLGKLDSSVNALDDKLDSCARAIDTARDYQKEQNGNLASAVAEVARVKDAAAAAAGAASSAAAAAASVSSLAASAAAEIAHLKEEAARTEGQGHGVGLTWQWILAGGMFLLGIVSPVLLVAHMVWG